jgi:hypothetical protein
VIAGMASNSNNRMQNVFTIGLVPLIGAVRSRS